MGLSITARVLAAIAVIVVALVAALGFGMRQTLAAWAIPKIIGSATGTSVSFAHMALHGNNATFTGVRVASHSGQQIAYVPRVYVTYALRDLLPGSTHRFGLRSLVVDHPQVSIVHNRDGTYNVPKQSRGPAANRQAAPLHFRARVIDGTLTVTDYTRVDPGSRHLYVDNVNLNASVDTAARSQYVAAMNYREGARLYPIHGAGTVDATAPFALHHWTAAHVPLPRLVNYGVNNANIRMLSGALDDVDLRYFGKLAASAYMRGAKVVMTGVSQPVREGHGELDVYEGGLTTPGVYARLGAVPVRVTGGIADFAHPQLRMAVNADGNVAQLKTLVKSTARLPMSGAVSAAMLVEGSVKEPLVLIRLNSPRIEYRGIAILNPHGLVAFDGREADVLNFRLNYRDFNVDARGRMSLHAQPGAVRMLAQVRGPSGALPYAASMLPGVQLHGTVVASGDDLKKIDTHGILEGSGAERLAALFSINSAGVGTAGPLTIEGPGRSLYGRVALNRPQGTLSALLSARNFPIVLPKPAVSGTWTGAVYAEKTGDRLGMLGDAHVTGARYGKVQVADARARFGGSVGNIRIPLLTASGAFGDLRAAGTISGANRVALEGRYRGSLAALSRIAGNVPASGSVDAPIALVYEGGRTIAQIHDARFTRASIRGVPVQGLSATVAARGNAVRIYVARASLSGNGTASVTGSSGSRMFVSISNLQLKTLRAAGLPLDSGRADVAAIVGGSLEAPSVSGSMLLRDGSYRRYPVALQSAFAYSGDRLALRDGMVGLGPAFVAVDGSVGGIAIGAPVRPRYDVDAVLHGADAHALAALAQPALAKQYIEGSIDARVHVGGSGNAPAVSGTVNVPSGSVHGLAFRDMRATLRGTPRHFALDGGRVRIGTTALAFAGAMSGGAMQASVRAPRADLADFNDYFDTGDTLEGTGGLALDVSAGRNTLQSSGNVRLAGFRYRRFEVGRANAIWRTAGRKMAVVADVGGASGRGHLAGSVTVPAFRTMADLAAHADTHLAARVSGLDLGTWLPMFGYAAPVTGTLDATARVSGRFPDESIEATAALHNGTVGRVRLQKAQLAVSASRGRGTIRQAVVQMPYLTANGAGTFGLHARDPLDLSVHATSPDVGKLASGITGAQRDVAGMLETTLRVTGTRLDPRLDDTFALRDLRYGKISVPQIVAHIAATPTRVAVSGGLVRLQRGSIALSGVVPITVKPRFELDPGDKPVRFTLAADNVDFSNFEALLPPGSHLAGTFGGAMAVNGRLDAPLLYGSLTLHNGYYAGPLDQDPIARLTGKLAFNGTKLALYDLHANVGGGTMDLNGNASVPNVRDARDATFKATILAKNAQFNSPQYFRGKVDADIVAYRSTPRSIPVIAGTVDVPSARIPLTAFWNPKAAKGPPKALPDIAFDIHARAGNDVRVQSSNVDVGAQGAVTVGGTLPKPTLAGEVGTTGGTVDFFRRFTIENASVHFDPANGIMPYVNATATTQVPDPLTYIALNVRGLAPDNMQIAFSSDPTYDRAQIMGLLAGVNQLNGPRPGGGIGGFSVASTVQNMATGELNTFFTREMLQPLSAALGSAMGLQNLQLTDDFHSGFGLSAAKAFGKHLTAVYAESLGTPRRQTLDIEAHRGESTAFDLMLYNVESPTLLGFQQTMGNMLGFSGGLSPVLNPTLGTNGMSLLYEHKF